MRKLLIVLLLAGATGRASVIFDLDMPIRSGLPGDVLTFTGTLFNDDVVDVFFNAASATLPYPELGVDFTAFFTLIPLSLPSGGSYSGPIFDVDLTNNVIPGDYFGSFTLQGGPDWSTVNDLASENFQVTVPGMSSVPEPSMVPVLSFLVLLYCATTRTRNAKLRDRPTVISG